MPCARKRGRSDLAFPAPECPLSECLAGLAFPCFVFYPMTMTRIGIVMIDSTVVTKVP